jgi:hypothetical protein
MVLKLKRKYCPYFVIFALKKQKTKFAFYLSFLLPFSLTYFRPGLGNNPHVVHMGTNNPHVIHMGTNNTHVLHMGSNNPHVIHMGTNNFIE